MTSFTQTSPSPLSFSPLTLLILSIIALPFLYTIYTLFLHPLSRIPGPFPARLSRLWILSHSRRGDMNTTMIALHAQHGPLVRTAPNEVSVSDLSAIKTIYGAGTKFRKSDWYSVWQGHRKFDLFGERDERIHAGQRKLVSRAYAMESLRNLEPYVDKTVEVFMARMAELSAKGEVVDMGNWVQLFAFDVIGEVTFSKTFGFLDVGEDDGSFKAIEEAFKSAAWIGQVPWLYWIHDALSPYIGNHLGIAARHGRLRQFAVREIAARKDRGSSGRKDILDQLTATQKAKPLEMDDNAVTSMATSNIFAGSDTTAISTRAIIYYLLKNPSCKRKLVEEIDTYRKEGEPITFAQADKMPYLQACMYEALRLHPAVGFSLPRVVPPGGATIATTFLPAGTVIGANPWVIHRDKDVYGDDVESFRPERWLQEDRNGDMYRFFFAFGAGARGCLGRNISWMEMSKLIPELFGRFEVELAEPGREWDVSCWWFVLQRGVNVRLRERVR